MVHVLVRTVGDPQLAANLVRKTVLEADPAAAVTIQTLTASLAFAFLPSQIGALLVGALGLLGASLATVGLYGVIAFMVTRRTAEIGIRMALRGRRLCGSCSRNCAALVGCGLVLGLAMAFLVTRPLAAFLVAALPPTDVVSVVGSALLLLLAALLASWNPVRRATRVAPATALRTD